VRDPASRRRIAVSTTTAQFVLKHLAAHGVRWIYGYPGDGIDGLLGAFHGMEDELPRSSVRRSRASSPSS
jgi:pyruvate dehydrogenase (quinone)